MKKLSAVILLLIGLLVCQDVYSQGLGNLGRRVEKKVNDRVNRKVDRSIDKVLDKADRETDKPLDDALNKPSGKKEKASEKPAKQQTNSDTAPVQEPAPPAAKDQLLEISGSCTDFIWFKKGAFMEFEAKDGKNKNLQKSKMTIINIHQEGQGTVADVKASDDKNNEFDMQFKCIGDKMYMDFGAIMKQAMQQAGQSGADAAAVQKAMENTEMSFTDGFMEFPKQMYPGQQLDDVSFTLKTSPSPQVSMEVISTLENRKVVAREKIQTPAGSFDCVKISGQRRTSMKVMGMNQKMPSSTEYIWFAKGLGVVKQEDYDEKGKLQSVNQLVNYKL